MPRARFSVRGLMIGVAVVAIVILIGDSLRRLSNEYREKAGRFRGMAHVLTQAYPGPGGRERQIEYCEQMAAKYERAARCPLMPVPSDPPEPR